MVVGLLAAVASPSAVDLRGPSCSVPGKIAMVEVSLLKHFITVAQTGSFTRAAEILNTNQSVVSRAIKRVEEEIGSPLFERTTRNVRLTPAGEAFLSEALSVIDRLAVATSNARRIGRGEVARLKIGICPSTVVETPQISRGLQRFRDMWPKVELELELTIGNVQCEQLRAAEIDVGIMRPGRSHRRGI